MCKSERKLKTYEWNRDVSLLSCISPTQWFVFHSEYLLIWRTFCPAPMPHIQDKKKKGAHVRGEFQTSENGWWARSGRRGLQELRKHSLQTLLFPPSSVHPDVPKELFCHDSPVRVVLSTPAGTWCHFLGSTSDAENLPSTASDRDGPTPSKVCGERFLNTELMRYTIRINKL